MNKLNSATFALTLLTLSCNPNNEKSKASTQTQKETNVTLPTTEKWVKSPVRNKLVVILNTPIEAVWDLVGDPTNMPKFSSGLDSVTTITENGKCMQYTCYFKPVKKGEVGYVHTDHMLWQEKNRGWASRTPEPNEMGFKEYLSLLTLEELDGKTRLTWLMTCDHEKPEMIEMNKQGLVQAFDDIGKQLVNTFGGIVVENYVEQKTAK